MVEFDTKTLPENAQFDAWHTTVGAVFDASLSAERASKDGFAASLKACDIGGAVFGETRSEEQLFSRDTKRIAFDGLDHIMLQVFLDGGGCTQDGRQVGKGDLLVIDMAKPHRMLKLLAG